MVALPGRLSIRRKLRPAGGSSLAAGRGGPLPPPRASEAQPVTPIDIRPADLDTVRRILHEHVPSLEVHAFGSRVAWNARATSDLDLALMTAKPLSIDRTARLRAAFGNSHLPFRVDIVDWATASESFRQRILENHVALRTARVEWPIRRFEELLDEPVRNGIYKSKEHHGHGVKIVNMGEIFAHPRLRAVPMKRVGLSESEIDRFAIAKGDLLFARRSLVAEGAGKCCVVLDVDEPTTFESSIIRARPDATLSDPLYLYYFFSSRAGLHRLDSIRRQVAVAGITGRDLSGLEIPTPPLLDQRAIAHILGTLDDRIELNRRMNATLEAMARALFRSWFVDFDPVRAKMQGRATGLPKHIDDLFPDRLVDSELGEIPAGWTVGHLEDGFDIVMGQSPPGHTYNDIGDGLPFFQGSSDFGFRFPKNRKFCTAPNRIAQPWDTIVSVRAPVGEINMAWERCGIGRGVAVLRPRSGAVSYGYCAAQALQPHMREYEHTGTVFGAINRKQLARLPLQRPAPAVVRCFEDLVHPSDQTIRFRTAQVAILTALRDALLPKLVSGELWVPDADALVGASYDRDGRCRSRPTAAEKPEGRETDVDNDKGGPHVQLVGSIETGILGAPPAPMSASEIVWSRRAAMRHADYRAYPEAQWNALFDEIVKWGMAQRYHAVLATESGEPAGSGVCVTSGGRRGILTARHVLTAYADGEEWQTNLCIGFAPPRDEMVQEQLRRQYGGQHNRDPLGPFRGTGISLGDRVVVSPLQREDKAYPDPGLPDVAIIVVSDDIEERVRKAARDEGTAIPEPRWVDLDREDRVSVPYDPASNEDMMLAGSWLVTGLRGERSGVTKFYTELDGIAVDRIYRRSEYEYYGVFVDEVGGTRAQSRSWKGTSGGGVWQQRLTQSGWQKMERASALSLTPDDLEPPVLGGIAFFHETRKSPQELRGDLDGKRCYRGEVYAHRIGGTLLDVIRRALRHGAKMVEPADGELVGGADRE